jgi:hypothetical protein
MSGQFDNYTVQQDIDNISLAIIADFVQAELIAKPGLANSVLDLTRMVGKGMKSVTIPKFNSFVAERKIAAKPLTAQKLNSNPDILYLNKPDAVYTIIEDVAEMQSSVEMLELYATRIASALNKRWDYEIYQSLLTTSEAMAFASGTTVTKADFTNADEHLENNEIPIHDGQGKFLVVNPAQKKAIMNLSDFVDADKWFSGSEEIKTTGQIGVAYGYNIIVSTQYARPVFYHKMAAAYARQKTLNFSQANSPEDLGLKLSGWHLYGNCGLQGGLAAVRLGA